MVYFPIIEKRDPVPEKCPGCGKWYIANPNEYSFGCLVLHAPGSCCHINEQEVEAPELRGS